MDETNPLPEFEDTFQRFVTAGGLDWLPTTAIAEDWERKARQDNDKHEPMRCRHGKTTLTCSECYLDGTRKGWW